MHFSSYHFCQSDCCWFFVISIQRIRRHVKKWRQQPTQFQQKSTQTQTHTHSHTHTLSTFVSSSFLLFAFKGQFKMYREWTIESSSKFLCRNKRLYELCCCCCCFFLSIIHFARIWIWIIWPTKNQQCHFNFNNRDLKEFNEFFLYKC